MNKQIVIPYRYFSSSAELDAIEKELFQKASAARAKAYAPYSDFNVGCAILLDNGKIITGSNQENAAFPSGLCAERATIFWTAANYPDVRINKIFVVGGPNASTESTTAIPPCGACRQSILEYERRQEHEIEIYFGAVEGEIFMTKSVSALLPFSFDSTFL